MSAPALRPFLPADTPVLAAIFVASIEGLTGDDYGEAQQEAWAAVADDEDEFGKRLASGLTLVATLDSSPVGFAALKGKDHVDLLYVHPGAVGQGVAAMLCDALEKLAAARGAKNLTVDARQCRRVLRQTRLRGPAAQHSFAQRRMARQHHHAETAW
jgi:putative acetyltransferase